MPEDFGLNFINEVKKVKDQKGDNISLADIVQILEKVMGYMSASDKMIFEEIKNISQKIKEVKGNVAGISDEEISKKFISDANLELNAVVKATSDATNKILDAAENIQKEATKLPEDVRKPIVDKVTEIFEASTFQDITGQRIKKVVSVLIDIEKSIENLINVFGGKVAAGNSAVKAVKTDKDLMRGPQIEQPKQDEIDKIFKSLDKKG